MQFQRTGTLPVSSICQTIIFSRQHLKALILWPGNLHVLVIWTSFGLHGQRDSSLNELGEYVWKGTVFPNAMLTYLYSLFAVACDDLQSHPLRPSCSSFSTFAIYFIYYILMLLFLGCVGGVYCIVLNPSLPLSSSSCYTICTLFHHVYRVHVLSCMLRQKVKDIDISYSYCFALNVRLLSRYNLSWKTFEGGRKLENPEGPYTGTWKGNAWNVTRIESDSFREWPGFKWKNSSRRTERFQVRTCGSRGFLPHNLLQAFSSAELRSMSHRCS